MSAEQIDENVQGTKLNMEDLDSLDQVMDKQRYEEEDAFIKDFEDPDGLLGKPEEEQPLQKKSVLDDAPALPNNNTGEQIDDEESENITINELDENLTAEEKKEIEDLNRKFGTDFKDIDEFKALLKKDENKEVVNQIEKDRSLMNYFEEILTQWSDSDIVYKDKVLIAEQKGIDIKDPDNIEVIKEEIADLEASNQLSYAARAIKAEIREKNNELKQKVNTYDNTQSQTKEQREQQEKEALGNAVSEFFKQPNFYGAKLEKKTFIDAYRKVSKGELIKHIKEDPKLAVELQLFIDARETLAKLNGSATYSDGIKDTFDAIKGQNPKDTSKGGNTIRRSSNLPNFIADFIR